MLNKIGGANMPPITSLLLKLTVHIVTTGIANSVTVITIEITLDLIQTNHLTTYCVSPDRSI